MSMLLPVIPFQGLRRGTQPRQTNYLRCFAAPAAAEWSHVHQSPYPTRTPARHASSLSLK